MNLNIFSYVWGLFMFLCLFMVFSHFLLDGAWIMSLNFYRMCIYVFVCGMLHIFSPSLSIILWFCLGCVFFRCESLCFVVIFLHLSFDYPWIFESWLESISYTFNKVKEEFTYDFFIYLYAFIFYIQLSSLLELTLVYSTRDGSNFILSQMATQFSSTIY